MSSVNDSINFIENLWCIKKWKIILLLAFIIIMKKHKTMKEDEKVKAMHWLVAFATGWIIPADNRSVFAQLYIIIAL